MIDKHLERGDAGLRSLGAQDFDGAPEVFTPRASGARSPRNTMGCGNTGAWVMRTMVGMRARCGSNGTATAAVGGGCPTMTACCCWAPSLTSSATLRVVSTPMAGQRKKATERTKPGSFIRAGARMDSARA